jgi:uncharacterized RDD family membrane protein YckC
MIDQTQSPTVGAAPDGRLLATAGSRFVARILDTLVLLAALAVAVGLLIGMSAGFRAIHAEPPTVVGAIVIGLMLLGVPYLYEVEFARWRGGRTLGKAALRIAIAPLAAGAPLTRGMLARRWASALAFNALTQVFVGYLDPLWLLWDKPYRQCLHDKAAGTVVVRY